MWCWLLFDLIREALLKFNRSKHKRKAHVAKFSSSSTYESQGSTSQLKVNIDILFTVAASSWLIYNLFSFYKQ